MAELKVNDLAYHAWIRDLKAYYRQLQIGVVNLPQVVEDNSMIDLMKVPWGHHIIPKIKKAVDKLEVVVDETFMELTITPKRGTASKGKEVFNG